METGDNNLRVEPHGRRRGLAQVALCDPVSRPVAQTRKLSLHVGPFKRKTAHRGAGDVADAAAGAAPRIANNGPSANSSALRASVHTSHLGARGCDGGGLITAARVGWTTA